jgi:enoyl-CoA hydratase/carnithine racemase
MIIRGYHMTWNDGMALEAELTGRVRNSDDFKEGARAFAEKRKPVFEGK